MRSDLGDLLRTFEVIAGTVYSDDWISPELTLRLDPPATGGRFQISLWNPDFAPALAQNRIDIQFAGKSECITGIGPNQVVDIVLRAPSASPETVSLNVAHFLNACDYDQRDRALKLITAHWLNDKTP